MSVLDPTMIKGLPHFGNFGPLGEAFKRCNPYQASRRGTPCMWQFYGVCEEDGHCNPDCTYTETQQGMLLWATPCERRWVFTRCAERPDGLFIEMKNQKLAGFLDDARLESTIETVIDDETFVREASTVTLNDAQCKSTGCDLSKIWFNTILKGDDAYWTIHTKHYKHVPIAPVVFAAPDDPPHVAPYEPAAGETHLVVRGPDGLVGRMPMWQGEHLAYNAMIRALLAPGTIPVLKFPNDNVSAWVQGENPTFEVSRCRAKQKTLAMCFESFDAVEVEIASDAEVDDAEVEAENVEDAEREEADAPARTINWSEKPDGSDDTGDGSDDTGDGSDDDYDEREVPFPLGGCMAIIKNGRLVIYDNNDSDDDDALARGSYGPALAADCASCASA